MLDCILRYIVWFGVVFNATFNNISVISWRSEVSYIVAVSFIGGGNRSTRGNLPTCRIGH